MRQCYLHIILSSRSTIKQIILAIICEKIELVEPYLSSIDFDLMVVEDRTIIVAKTQISEVLFAYVYCVCIKFYCNAYTYF